MKSTARADAPAASTAYARTRSPGASTQSARLRYQGSVWKKLALPARDRSGSYRAGSAARSVYTAVVYMCKSTLPSTRCTTNPAPENRLYRHGLGAGIVASPLGESAAGGETYCTLETLARVASSSASHSVISSVDQKGSPATAAARTLSPF